MALSSPANSLFSFGTCLFILATSVAVGCDSRGSSDSPVAPTLPVAVPTPPFTPVLLRLVDGHTYRLSLIGNDQSADAGQVQCSPIGVPNGGKAVDVPVSVVEVGGEWIARSRDIDGRGLELRLRSTGAAGVDGTVQGIGSLRGVAADEGYEEIRAPSGVSIRVGGEEGESASLTATGRGWSVSGTAVGPVAFVDRHGAVGRCTGVIVFLR